MEVGIASALRERHRAIRDTQSEALAIRLHRAISWLAAAESSLHDNDTRFIQLWIAFNAAYAGEFPNEQRERQRVTDFVTRLINSDVQNRLHALLFKQFSGPIRLLIDNRYVYAPFWAALRDHDSSERWRIQFYASRKAAMDALLGSRLAELLTIVLNRLYVLRNQLVHGGATWNSNINRDQLRDGNALLGALVPVIITVMMETDAFEGDAIAYPIVPQRPSTSRSDAQPLNTDQCLQDPATATETDESTN